ncbi:MAG TPA: Rieske 2Fe-2S domain-containing protein [Acidimicrobiales bacterium]|nr:Rieske 2Fe-2S domain-containing protein [Acidimicrobiales bacterium]
MAPPERVRVGTLAELAERGCLTAKLGTRPVCVFYDEGDVYAVEDRCPHMGFPLRRGTVQGGLLTCHWHHARFDLASGGTLDPFADDVPAFPVEITDGDVHVLASPDSDRVSRLYRRLEEGLEQGITLVIAKAVLGLLEAGVAAEEIVESGVAFGTKYRAEGWGPGLTVLVAMANVLPLLDPAERPLAIVHGLAFLSGDTVGRSPRFPLMPLESALPIERLSTWYRRFIDTRSAEAAERTLATAIAAGHDAAGVAAMMSAAVTDHVFVNEGHTIDFTNKAFECLEHIGWGRAEEVLTTLVAQTASAQRHEEEAAWRHPVDLTVLLSASATADVLRARLVAAAGRSELSAEFADEDVDALAWVLLSDDPVGIIGCLDRALDAGASAEQLARAVAYAAALRIVRFHTQNDHGDWNEVHHAFTAANAVHQSVLRAPSVELLRGVYQGAMRVYLDRFLNVPAARQPSASASAPSAEAGLSELQVCWDREGGVDDAGQIAYRYLAGGGDPDQLIASLGRALLTEDAQFHWFQIYEAAVRQYAAWPVGSEQGWLILVGAARFLAAHTPTRRERSQVVRIATRLRRGEPLYEEDV